MIERFYTEQRRRVFPIVPDPETGEIITDPARARRVAKWYMKAERKRETAGRRRGNAKKRREAARRRREIAAGKKIDAEHRIFHLHLPRE